MQIPVIDLSPAGDEAGQVAAIAAALSGPGFMQITGLGIDADRLAAVYRASLDFFSGPETVKAQCAYRSSEENFGFQGVGEENLDPQAPADLKQTFTMRNILQAPIEASRWPSPAFRALMMAFYDDVFDGARRLQTLLARGLGAPDDFFSACHSGENVTLRLLHYPPQQSGGLDAGQLGAGAHTDYGLLTLLFQDSVGGLQVQDKAGIWHPVAPHDQAIVINCGDLLERWTNGRYRSTPHRVLPNEKPRARLSIAMFMDPDSATQVHALPSCVSADHPPRFAPTTAGAHLHDKLTQSHKGRFAP